MRRASREALRLTTVAILQPGYLPWLGFFDQLRRCDVFVYYDDVQFDKHGWRNRNRVKGPAGPQWLTVPVLHTGRGQPAIHEIELEPRVPWARKHLRTLELLYAKAPHREPYLTELAAVLTQPWSRLAELDIAAVELISRWLALQRTMHRSSQLGISGDRSERLLKICQNFSADRYLSGNAAQSYLDTDLFERNGIAVEWQNFTHPTYPQLHGEFVPFLSTIDLVFNVGARALDVIAGRPG
jgi:hypothetical protein